MQQTDKYKLNKPGVDDPIAIAPLNENADKVDAALTDHEQRVIALENCRIIIGVYQKYNNASGQIIDLGGRPAAVFACGHGVNSPHMGFVVGDGKAINGYNGKECLRIVDNGFEVHDLLTYTEDDFYFIAFMGDWAPMNVPKVEAT